MNEPELRVVIQKLTKRLTPQFENEAKTSEERIKVVLSQPEVGQKLAKKLGLAVDINSSSMEWALKNEDLAKRNKEDGNSAFTSGNLELAITLYTEAMKYAKVHESLWEGETMATAAGNR